MEQIDKEYNQLIAEEGAVVMAEQLLVERDNTLQRCLGILLKCHEARRADLAALNEDQGYREMVCGAFVCVALSLEPVGSLMLRTADQRGRIRGRLEFIRTVAGAIAPLLDVDPEVIIAGLMEPDVLEGKENANAKTRM